MTAMGFTTAHKEAQARAIDVGVSGSEDGDQEEEPMMERYRVPQAQVNCANVNQRANPNQMTALAAAAVRARVARRAGRQALLALADTQRPVHASQVGTVRLLRAGWHRHQRFHRRGFT